MAIERPNIHVYLNKPPSFHKKLFHIDMEKAASITLDYLGVMHGSGQIEDNRRCDIPLGLQQSRHMHSQNSYTGVQLIW